MCDLAVYAYLTIVTRIIYQHRFMYSILAGIVYKHRYIYSIY